MEATFHTMALVYDPSDLSTLERLKLKKNLTEIWWVSAKFDEKKRFEAPKKRKFKFAKIRSKAVEFNYMPQANRPTLALVEEKFHKENFRVNREMREKICVIWPNFGRILTNCHQNANLGYAEISNFGSQIQIRFWNLKSNF